MLFLRNRKFFGRFYDKNGESKFDFIRNYKLNSSAKKYCSGERTSMFTPLLEEAYTYSFE